MKINLFDAAFAHDRFSTAYQETDAIEWVRAQMVWDGITVFSDAYLESPLVDQVQSPVKIGWLREPACLWDGLYHKVSFPDIYEKFDFILTYYQPLLDHPSGRFRFVPYAGIWIPQSEWGLRPKSKRISMLYGAKLTTGGHKIRHEIAHALGDRYGIDYYGTRGQQVSYSWQTKLQVLKDYQYSIVCETCREDNLFTEILLDCFAVGTIPIFWGCPNASKYFDRMGILSFQNVYQLESLLRELDEHTYTYLTPFAKRNLDASKPYRITEEWMVSNGVFDGAMA